MIRVLHGEDEYSRSEALVRFRAAAGPPEVRDPNTTVFLICHSTSAYPCVPSELNLNLIGTLAREFGVPIGYSGHEVGLSTTVAAAVLGACLVERHITLDRTMWGSDQSASVEPQGVATLVRDIRVFESALGDGVKKVYDSEIGVMQKLRRAPGN